MKFKPKLKFYPIASFSIIGILLVLYSLSPNIPEKGKEPLIEMIKTPAQLENNPFFMLIGIIYFSLLLAGLINMLILLVKKIKRQKIIPTNEPETPGLSLHDIEGNWKALFFILAAFFMLNLSSIFFTYADAAQKLSIYTIICTFMMEAIPIIILIRILSSS